MATKPVRIKIEKEVRIPGTKTILERGDIIEVYPSDRYLEDEDGDIDGEDEEDQDEGFDNDAGDNDKD